MKRFILAVLLVMLMAVPVFAQDMVNFAGLNIQGDTVFLPSSGKFAVGAGMTLATVYHDIFEVRGEAVFPTDSDVANKYGLGVGVNVPKIVTMIGGNWVAAGINPSISVIGLVDFKDEPHLEPAVVLTLIQVGF